MPWAKLWISALLLSTLSVKGDIPAPLGIEPMLLSSGSVNVITGEYCDVKTDMTVRCAEPISLQRYHMGAEVEGSGRGLWHLFREEIIAHVEEEGLSVNLYESDGTVIPFSFDEEDKDMILRSHWSRKAASPHLGGLTLDPGEEEGGWERRCDSLKHSSEGQFILKRGNHEIRTYMRVHPCAYNPIKYNPMRRGHHGADEDIVYLLVKVVRPNGNKIHYEYDAQGNLIEICSTDSSEEKTFGTITLSHTLTKTHAIGSDGQEVTYRFSRHQCQKKPFARIMSTYCLSQVVLPGNIIHTYSYDRTWNVDYSPFSLIGLSRNKSRQGIDYWWRGWNRWGMHSVHVGEKDLKLGRVRCQTLTLDETSGGVPTRSYFYYKDKKGGHTDVIDALGQPQTHYYTEYGRLDAIGSPTGYERYWWDGWDGSLWMKGWFDLGGKRGMLATRYKSFWRGETLASLESLHLGNHTGSSEGYLVFENNKCVPYDLESLSHCCTYHIEDRHPTTLIEREEDPWTETHYTYKKGTNLVTGKLTYEKTAKGPLLRNREFCDYEGAFLTQQVVDNGSSCEQSNSAGVTESKTTKISLNDDCLPEAIEIYDLEGLASRKILYYDSHNLVVQEDIFGSDGRFAYSIHRDYDDAGRTTREADPMGNENHYTYNDLGLVTSTKKGPITTTHTYDSAGRCIATTLLGEGGEPFTETHTYDPLGRKTSTTDYAGRETRYEYDAAGNVTQVISPRLRMDGGHWFSPRVKRQYNELGHMTTETGPDGLTTYYRRTSRGDPYYIAYPGGKQERFEYNLQGHLVKHTTEVGSYILYERDYLGRELSTATYSSEGELVAQTATTYEGSRKTSCIDEEGHETRWRYDGRGQLIETRGESTRTTYRYDRLGRLAAQTEWYGSNLREEITIVWEYDPLGRPISEKKRDGQGNVLSQTDTEYDIQNMPIRTITHNDGKRIEVCKSYDLLGRLAEETDPLGQKTITNRSAVEFEGQVCLQQSIWDPANGLSVITYDGMDHAIVEESRSPSGELLSRTERSFNLRGDPTLETTTLVEEGQADRTLSTRWEYDHYGRISTLREAFNTPEQRITRYHHNHLGQLLKTVKPSGAAITYHYDTLGRLARQEGEGFAYSYTYNRCGEVILVGGNERSYDGEGNVLRETFDHGRSIQFEYDGLSRCTSLKLHDGSSVQYQYGARLERIDRLHPGGMIDYSHHYLAYDQLGMPLHTQHIFGGDILFSYDSLGRCVETQSHAYYEALRHFDPLGSLLSRLTRDSQTLEHTYTYTPLNQLASESGIQTHTYTYDSLANRTSTDGQKARYNSLNQLLTDGTNHYTYDLDGRLITLETPTETLHFTYDGLDRLLTVTNGTQTLKFTYDAYNRRMSKEVLELKHETWHPTSKCYFLYEGKNEIGACDEQGHLVEFRALGLGLGAEIGAAVSIELNGVPYAPIHDYRGSVVALVDSHNRLAEYYRYTAFGTCEIRDAKHRLQDTSPLGNPYRFSSKRIDEETGLVFFGERYYLPAIGRWITPDPLGFADGPNFYTYLGGNPILHLDLWGLSKRKKWTIRALVAAAIAMIGAAIASDAYEHHIQSMAYGNTQVPQIKGWEKDYPEKTSTYTTSSDPPKENGNNAVNGIRTKKKEAQSNAEYLKSLTGEELNYTHSPTGGIRDLFRAALGIFGAATEPARELKAEWMRFFAENPNGIYHQWCHSEGAIHTRNALLLMPRHLRKRIIVTAIAPAVYIQPALCRNVQHIVSNRDLVPWINTFGRLRSKDWVNVVSAHPKAKGMDHSLQSPTYVQPIKDRNQDVKIMRNRLT